VLIHLSMLRLILCTLLGSSFAQLPASDDVIRLVPKPSSVIFQDGARNLLLNEADFSITGTTSSANQDILDFNCQDTMTEIFKRTSATVEAEDDSSIPLTSLLLTILNDDSDKVYPSAEMDESYSISLTAPSATLTANSVFGAVKGLETFSQLFQMNRAIQIRRLASVTKLHHPLLN